MTKHKFSTIVENIKRSLTHRRAHAVPSYFELLETRMLMSSVDVVPQLPLPVISISAVDASAAESAKGNQNATFKISRTGGVATDLVVYYSIAGTATNGADYQTLNGQITILAGKSSALIALNPTDDAVYEPTESVVLTLNLNGGYLLSGSTKRQSATATIRDNESRVTLKVTDKIAQESLDGKNTGTYIVTRSGGDISKDLVVHYTVDVNDINIAVAGGDYAKLSGSVTIPASQRSAKITINPLDDAKSENDEKVILRVKADEAYASDSSKSATVTIKDWELAPTSIRGYTFETATVDSATGSLAGSDGFSIFMAGSNSTYTFATDNDENTLPFGLLSKTGNVWQTAEVRYARVASDEAVFVTTSLAGYGVVTGKLKFITANKLMYEITLEDGSTMTGSMKMSTSGDVPTSLDDWRIRVKATEGTGNFASSGNYSIAIDDRNYRLNADRTITTGTISGTTRFNDHFWIVKVKDSRLKTDVTIYLNFSAPGKASYYMVDSNGYQRGTLSFATPKPGEWWYAPINNTGGISGAGLIAIGNLIPAPPTYVNIYQVITASGSVITDAAGGFGTISVARSIVESASKGINPTTEWLDRYLFQPIMNGFVNGLEGSASKIIVYIQDSYYATSLSYTVTLATADGRSSSFYLNSNKWWTIQSDHGLGSDITEINPAFANLVI